MKRQHRAARAVAALVVSWSSAAAAGITGTTGQVLQIAAPASIAPGQSESDAVLQVFPERTDVMLGADLDVDMSVAYSLYDPPMGATPATIPAGTVVSSYYVALDPSGGFRRLKGSITFAEPILGVIAQGLPGTDTLGASNLLGNPSTTYPSAINYVGIETTTDNLRLYSGTLSLDVATISSGVDHVRIITAASGTPSPPVAIPAYGKRLAIKDAYDEGLPEDRSLLVQMQGVMIDPVLVNPVATGASVDVYSATDRACLHLDASKWTSTPGGGFRYENPGGLCTKARLVKGALEVKCRARPGTGIGFSLDEPSQGAVNADLNAGAVRICTTLDPPYVARDVGADLLIDPDSRGLFHGSRRSSAPPPTSCVPPPLPSCP